MEKEAGYKIKPTTDFRAILKHMASQGQHKIKCSDLLK